MADYAQIVVIEARDSAAQGDLVSIAVQVKNLADYGFYVSLTGDQNGSGITFSPGLLRSRRGRHLHFLRFFLYAQSKPDYNRNLLVVGFR